MCRHVCTTDMSVDMSVLCTVLHLIYITSKSLSAPCGRLLPAACLLLLTVILSLSFCTTDMTVDMCINTRRACVYTCARHVLHALGRFLPRRSFLLLARLYPQSRHAVGDANMEHQTSGRRQRSLHIVDHPSTPQSIPRWVPEPPVPRVSWAVEPVPAAVVAAAVVKLVHERAQSDVPAKLCCGKTCRTQNSQPSMQHRQRNPHGPASPFTLCTALCPN